MQEGAEGRGLGVRLRRLRKQRGLSQTALGEPLCTPAYISQIESGIRQPSQVLVDHFASRLGVDPGELLTGRREVAAPELELKIQEAKILLYQGDGERALPALNSTARKARRNRLPRVEARAHEALGTLHERSGDLDSALEAFHKANDLLRQEPLGERAEAVAGIARCTEMDGDVRYAIHILESYLLELRSEPAPDPGALMRTHAALSHAYYGAGLNERALSAAEEARSYEAKSDDPQRLACMYVNVARALMQDKRYAEALVSLARAEEVFHNLNWKIQVARTKINKGIVLIQKQELDQARATLHDALALLEEAPSLIDEAAALTELGKVERLAGSVSLARDHLKRAAGAARSGDLAQLARVHREIGLSYQDEDGVRAAKELRRAVQLFRDANQPVETAVTLGHVATVLRRDNHVDAALEAFEESIDTLQQLTFE